MKKTPAFKTEQGLPRRRDAMCYTRDKPCDLTKEAGSSAMYFEQFCLACLAHASYMIGSEAPPRWRTFVGQ